MKSLFHIRVAIGLSAIAFVPAMATDAVPQSVINTCMKAADSQGCVNVLTGKKTPQPEAKITVDLDKIRATGNSCPSGFAYIGGGYCQGIGCYYNPGGHDYRLGGKGWSCSGGLTMQFKGEPIRSTTDERCPLVEPEVGKQSSCYNGLSEAEIKSGRFLKRYPAGNEKNVIGYRFDWDRNESKVRIVQAPTSCSAYKLGLREGDLFVEYNQEMVPTDPERASQLFSQKVKPEGLHMVVHRNSTNHSYVITSDMLSDCEFPEITRPY